MKLTSFDLLLKPVLTEKSTLQSQHNKVVFEVHPAATKTQIKKAVKEAFKVDALKVNVLNYDGKVKRFRGIVGKRKAVKRAIVTLKEGQHIDLVTGA